MKIKTLVVPLLAVILIAGAVYYLARPQAEALGTAPAHGAHALSIGELSDAHVGHTVTIVGTIRQECPHTGCWAVIDDGSGQIRIDTNKGGFALPLRREGWRITVTGEVERLANGDLQISAQSAEL
ncbi:MAG: OB-fold nucleic acid binding domain-containing protein [Armatimonadota bacterium]